MQAVLAALCAHVSSVFAYIWPSQRHVGKLEKKSGVNHILKNWRKQLEQKTKYQKNGTFSTPPQSPIKT
jgi:hypothetical protein